ncbi:MAG: nascent polypeptide-associated complex protein [Nanobdellota archaeon]
MMPGMNQKQMKQMMKKMGMSQESLEADEVVIKLKDRKLVFNNPNVEKVNMMGQDTFQIVGEPEEQSLEENKLEISEDDIKTVMDQTGKNKDEVVQAIEETEGDLAEAILKLS